MFKSTVYNEWHQFLGQKVCVKESTYGTLQYFGETYFAEGFWCGIALDKAVGDNDGKVDDVRYFTCENNFGIFVPVSETSLMKHNSENTKFSIFNQSKGIKEFLNHSEIQKGIHNSGIVNSDQLISHDKSPPKNALNESYTISKDLPDKHTLSIIAEESAQILDISSFNFSQLRHVSGLDKPDDIGSASYANILSRTFSEAVASNQLKEVPDQNIKENDRNFLESDDSLGILPFDLLDLSSDDLLYRVETPYGNLKSIVNLSDDMRKDPDNRFQEIISNLPDLIDPDETIHPIFHAANSSLFCIQNFESPVLQNDSSSPKFASTPKHETNFSEISEEIEKGLNLTHNLSSESHVYHNVLVPNKDVEYIESVSKDTSVGETHLSVTPVNKSIKDSNVQYIDDITEGIHYSNPTTKAIKDLNLVESIATDFEYSKSLINLNSTQCVESTSEDLKYVEANEGIKDLNVTYCANYIEISKNDIDLNITRNMENISEDLKCISLNESIKEVNVTQYIGGISEDVKYESLDENAIDLNVTRCLENGTENLLNLTSTYPNELDHSSEELCKKVEAVNESSFVIQKDLILHEKTSAVLNISYEKNFKKLPELDEERLQSLNLCKVSMKENVKALKCVSKSRGRKSEFYSKSNISSSNAEKKQCREKFERHKIRKSVSCFGDKNELKTGLYEQQVRRNSLSGNISTSSTGDIPKAKVRSISKELPFRYSAKQTSLISNPSRIVAYQGKLTTSQENPVSCRSGIIKNINGNDLRHSNLKFEPSNFKVDKKDAKRSTLFKSQNNLSHSTLKFEPSNFKVDEKDAKQSTLFKSQNKKGYLNETVHLTNQTSEVKKVAIKSTRSAIKNFSHSTLKYDTSSCKKEASQSTQVESEDSKDCLLNGSMYLDDQIDDVGKTVKKPRSSMSIFSIKKTTEQNSISYTSSRNLLNETQHLDCETNEVGKTVIKKPRSMKFSSIQSSSSVHNTILYRNAKEKLNEVNNLNCQIGEGGKTVTKKPRSSMKFSSIQSSSSIHNSIPCRSNDLSLMNEGKYLDHQINELGKTIVKKPRNSMNFANIPQTSSEYSSIPSRNKMTCKKNMFPSKCEDYLNKVTKKLSIGSALNDKQNKILRIHKHSSSEKPNSAIPHNIIGGNNSPLGKGANYKSTPRKILKQVSQKQNLNGTVLLSNQESSSTQKIRAFKPPCIPKRGSRISTSRTSSNEACKLDTTIISNDPVLPNQRTSSKQTTEQSKACHLMNVRRTGSSISRIKPPAKYCPR